MTNANLQKVLKEAEVKMAEINLQKMQVEFEQEKYKIEMELKKKQEKNSEIKIYKDKILKTKDEIFEHQKKKNYLIAQKETGADGIKMAKKGLEKLEEDLEEARNGGNKEISLGQIKDNNVYTFNVFKSKKVKSESYESEITRVNLGNFDREDGGVGYNHITVSLKKHFFSDQSNLCTVFTQRKYLDSYGQKIKSFKNTIMNKEELIEELKSKKRGIDAKIDEQDSIIENLEEKIEYYNENIEEIVNN